VRDTLRRDVKRGLRAGLDTFWLLARTMVPAYLGALVLQELGVIEWLSERIAPLMSLVGLPGEAALPLILGYVLNIYAAVGAMQALTLTPQEVTALALASLIGHNLLVEGAVLRKTGMNPFAFGLLRAVSGLAAAGVATALMRLFS
jgi:hypothetical protein